MATFEALAPFFPIFRCVPGRQPAAEPQPEGRRPPRRERQLLLHSLHPALAGKTRRYVRCLQFSDFHFQFSGTWVGLTKILTLNHVALLFPQAEMGR